MKIEYQDIFKIIDQTEGFLNKHVETELLFNLASSLEQGKNILEIGSYKGLSSICLAFGAKNTEGNLFCIDHFSYHDIWHENIKKNKLQATSIRGNANIVLQNLSIENLGMIFIDSSHYYDDCKIQFELATKRLKHRCLIAFHDHGHKEYPDVERYCSELEENKVLVNCKKESLLYFGYYNGIL
jgi:predicted O-methyltransferase YrrM